MLVELATSVGSKEYRDAGIALDDRPRRRSAPEPPHGGERIRWGQLTAAAWRRRWIHRDLVLGTPRLSSCSFAIAWCSGHRENSRPLAALPAPFHRLGEIDLSLDRPERPVRDAAAVGQSHDPEPLQHSFWHAHCQTLISLQRTFHDLDCSQINAGL